MAAVNLGRDKTEDKAKFAFKHDWFETNKELRKRYQDWLWIRVFVTD